jgi:hypothetical protein
MKSKIVSLNLRSVLLRQTRLSTFSNSCFIFCLCRPTAFLRSSLNFPQYSGTTLSCIKIILCTKLYKRSWSWRKKNQSRDRAYWWQVALETLVIWLRRVSF